MNTLKELGIDIVKKGTKAALMAVGSAFVLAVVEDKLRERLDIKSPSEESLKIGEYIRLQNERNGYDGKDI